MQTSLLEKKRTKYKKKVNREQKKKYRSKIIDKNEKDNLHKKKMEASRQPKKITKDLQTIIISAIDPYDAPLQWWESEHVRYAINYPPVKFRLEKVMGTHIVRLTDRKYMLLFAAKLLENHLEQQEIRIENRKLSLPSITSCLLKVSYKMLSEKIHYPRYRKLKFFM
ncbi:uncharacterized protein LOC122529001 [Frieseomelitta varia]|uniref:uncharacterized protein LOC122529001 n=1 Tax=Frieseomelitta varia TaxID=561572 RepID=UPI001CB6A5C7|nr:uncharacterized protein LOC122529001 [Frieseomelitta varia]